MAKAQKKRIKTLTAEMQGLSFKAGVYATAYVLSRSDKDRQIMERASEAAYEIQSQILALQAGAQPVNP